MITIVIAEDQRMLRGALAALLDLEDDFSVIGQAGDGLEALELAQQLQPDICLMDIEMPKLSGLDVAEQLHTQGTSCRVMILTTFARPGYFERAVAADVHGYLLKDESSDTLAEAIRRIMKGHREISPALIFGSTSATNPLTERERDVLRLVANGDSANDIAHSLHLTYGTVRNYISEIFSKLEVKSRIEAVQVAKENGWI